MDPSSRLAVLKAGLRQIWRLRAGTGEGRLITVSAELKLSVSAVGGVAEKIGALLILLSRLLGRGVEAVAWGEGHVVEGILKSDEQEWEDH